MSPIVYSTVGQNLAAKLRNALQPHANAGLRKYLVLATVRDTAESSTKTLSGIYKSAVLSEVHRVR
jgi:hypothetical protein